MELKASLYNGLTAIWHSDSNLLSIKRYVHLPENWKRVFYRGQSWDPCCFLCIWTIYILSVINWISFCMLMIRPLPVRYVRLLMEPIMMSVIFHRRLIRNYSKFRDWLTVNKLSLSVVKTKFMVFHKRVIANEDIPDLMIYDKKIARVSCFNFLGLTINEFMNWSSHSAKIANKISRTLGIMNRLKRYLPFSALKLVYDYDFVTSAIWYYMLGFWVE